MRLGGPGYVAIMLRERIAELASDFASEVIAALKAAPLAELTALTKKPLPPGYDLSARAAESPSEDEELTTVETTTTPAQQELFEESAPKTKGRKAGGKTKDAGGKSQGAKGKTAKPVAPVPARLDPKRINAALEFFEMRGSKGATAVQVDEHLKSSGFEGEIDVVAPLLERGEIRDAGIRRATGKGTAAVFVRSESTAS